MGNQPSTPSSSRHRKSGKETAADRAKKVVGDIQEEIKRSVKKLDDDHPAAQLIDSMCGGGYFDDDKYGQSRSVSSFYSEMSEEDGSRTVSEDDTYDDRSRRSRNDNTVESASYMSQSDYDSDPKSRGRKVSDSFDTADEPKPQTEEPTSLLSKPLASSFAKRCYFTKAGIGKTTQHYEGLTLTGNVVLMLAAAMKLKGCPTICDEDLRRVEQTYPNQFSRLPDELLLSSGWRRISKYCHFSNKPIPDGVPFFHSKQRLHPSGGYYFLLAASVGMTRPLDVEPLTKDTLVLLETDFPSQCDASPSVLISDPDQWTLVDKFCFFSGGPINTEEDVYYQADFDGNPIFMLAFLSPSLTPEELYKLGGGEEHGLKTIASVQEVESVYDLTERDFDDLKLYHLGPCRALPLYILQPQAWTKVLPPHFLFARQQALLRAEDWEARQGPPALVQQGPPPSVQQATVPPIATLPPIATQSTESELGMSAEIVDEFKREMEEEGAFVDSNAPMDETFAQRYALSPPGQRNDAHNVVLDNVSTPKLDPPDDEPPSLTISQDGAMSSIREPDNLVEQYFSAETSFHEIPDPEDPVISPDGERSEGGKSYFSQDQPGSAFGSPQKTSQAEEPFFASQVNAVSPTALRNDRSQRTHSSEFGGNWQREPEMQYGELTFEPQGSTVEDKRNGFSHSNPPMEVRPQGHLPMSPPSDDDLYGAEEKKMAMEETGNPSVVLSMSHESEKSGEADFIPIKRDGYKLSGSSPTSTTSRSSDGHQSAALRGAQDFLKRSRRRRLEVTGGSPESPGDDQSAGTWESGSELSGSNLSGVSSAWTDNSGTTGDRSSRRALILQMAKARMKNNKETTQVDKQSKLTMSIQEEVGPLSERNPDLDLGGDLD